MNDPVDRCSGYPDPNNAGIIHSREIRSSKAIHRKEGMMPESVYKIIELVGTSKESWEKAAAAAVAKAAGTLRDLRIAEVSQLDMQITDGKVEAYRAKVKVSFKFEDN